MWITTVQILQMIVGVTITAFGFIYSEDPSCGVVKPLLWAQGLMYGSYLYLFLDFMVNRFFKRPGLVERGMKFTKKVQ
jgi:hypothetical protein